MGLCVTNRLFLKLLVAVIPDLIRSLNYLEHSPIPYLLGFH